MKKTLKSVLCLILALAMAAAMCGCGKKTEQSAGDAGDAETTAPVDKTDNVDAAGNEAKETSGTVAGSELRIRLQSDTGSVVPYLNTGSVDKILTRQYADGLVNFYGADPSQIIPGLAESWDVSDDNLTYTFHIRQGAEFHSGKPVTAYDIEACLEFYKGIEGASQQFAPIVNYHADDDYTFVVELEQEWPSIFYYLGPVYCPIINVEMAEKNGQSIAGLDATGPYILESYTVGQSLVLKANQNYWDTPAEIETVEYIIIDDDNSALIALQTGDIDFLEDVSEITALSLADNNDVGIWSFETPTVHSLWYNTSDALVGQQTVREALSYMIDRAQVMAAGFGSTGVEADSYFGELIEGYVGGLVKEYDPDKGLALLDQAGINPSAMSFSILYSSQGPWGTCVENIQSQLGQYGIEVKLDGYDFFTFISMMFAGEFQTMFFNVDAFPAESVQAYTGALLTGTFNGARLNDGMPELFDELSVLLGEASVTADAETRQAILTEVMTKMGENCLATPICKQLKSYAYNKKFVPIISSQDGASMHYYWRLAD